MAVTSLIFINGNDMCCGKSIFRSTAFIEHSLVRRLPFDFLKLFSERNELILASAFSDTCEFLIKVSMNDRKTNPFNNVKYLPYTYSSASVGKNASV